MTIYYKYSLYERMQIVLKKLKRTITGQKRFYWLDYKSQFCVHLSLSTSTGTDILLQL